MIKTMFLAAMLAAPAVAHAAPADAVTTCDAEWRDDARGRDVPMRIRMPAGTGKAPVILFSHGLGGSLDGGTNWAVAWAKAGFIVVNLQHPGSDRSILGQGRIGAAMAPAQLVARVDDVHFVLDELGRRPREGVCDLRRVDLAHVGMSGHSFGAHTTQAIAGQRFPVAGIAADPRVKAAVAFSPSPPMRGSDAAAFGGIAIPFLSITGTEDAARVTPSITPKDRERPFRAMPAGGKYLLVIEGANHMMFNAQDGLRGPASTATPHIRATVIAATTLFWRATLLGDAAALSELAQFGATLPSGDRFEHR
ncbi:dienelactone hydrolase [Sphingomonas sp. BT-65]|uniref:alpha/beta hydrolase family protein n=1 Tax=Sphingomonas sp. BT-65 TaxID=2989821 RepID=UPI0022354C7C|nr:dienelactone hydrolase [Sphingomonas sp. BT-65]MCW4462021.1 dienelactone hydrolase [Sphingomonas sp. BT-65]